MLGKIYLSNAIILLVCLVNSLELSLEGHCFCLSKCSDADVCTCALNSFPFLSILNLMPNIEISLVLLVMKEHWQ